MRVEVAPRVSDLVVSTPLATAFRCWLGPMWHSGRLFGSVPAQGEEEHLIVRKRTQISHNCKKPDWFDVPTWCNRSRTRSGSRESPHRSHRKPRRMKSRGSHFRCRRSGLHGNLVTVDVVGVY